MELKIFENNAFGRVRIHIFNGEPMFCLSDICKSIGLQNPSSVKSRLDSEDVQLIDLHALTQNEGSIIGNSKANFVNESGFYDVLLQSDSPKVKPFRKWVTSEVLPSIRKHGMYATDDTIDKMINSPEFGIKLLTALQEERKAKAEAEAKLEEQRLKNKELSVSFEAKSIELEKSNETIGTLMETSETYKATDIAKELGLTSASALNAKLKDMKIQYRQGKDWYFYAEYSDKGYDSLKQHILPNGTATYTRTFTQAGRAFILEKFKEYRAKQRASVRQRPSRSNK